MVRKGLNGISVCVVVDLAERDASKPETLKDYITFKRGLGFLWFDWYLEVVKQY